MNAQQNLLKAVFDTAPTAVLILQSIRNEQQVIIDFEVLLANEAANKMAGRQVTGTRMLETWPTTQNIGLFDQFIDTITTNSPLTVDKHYAGEGVDAWLYWRAARLNDGLCVTIEDITERRRHQVQIQQAAQNLQRVLDSSPATIGLLKAIYDSVAPETVVDFQLIVGNQKLAQFFGEPLDELLGQPANRFGAMLWGEQTLERLRLVYHTRQTYYEEKPVDDGWMALSIHRDDHGLVITGMDITQLKEIQAQEQQWLTNLAQAQQNADALNKLRESLSHRSELMRALSHDLRANLGIMRSGLHLLDNAISETDRSQMMELVLRNVGQATDLLTNLLSFIQSETGQQQRAVTKIDVSQLIRELTQSLQAVAQQKNLWLKVEGPARFIVESDPLLLHRLLQNLAVNALKYTQTGGVTVQWNNEPDQHYWWLSIHDTGPGLTSELVASLSNSEVELADVLTTTTTNSAARPLDLITDWIPLQGESLGLRIVRQITTLLEGQLDVRSEPGVGTEFLLRFPCGYHL